MNHGTLRPQLFLSYSSADSAFVERLARDLKRLGVRIWWDREAIKVGDSITQRIQEGIAEAGWLAVVLSPASVSSAWVQQELSAALIKHLEQRDVFVLPLLYQDCSIPLFLRDKHYADFRSSYDEGLAAVVERLEPPLDPGVLGELMSENATRIRIAYVNLLPDKKGEYDHWMLARLESGAEHERLAAAMAVCELQVGGFERHLSALVKDPSDAVRRLAVHYVGRFRLRHELGAVAALMSDGSPMVRAAAREAYTQLGGHLS